MQLEFLNQHLSAASLVTDDHIDVEDYGIEDDGVDGDVYQRLDETNARPRISSIANPLSQAGFLYFSTIVRPLTLQDTDCSLYIDHVMFALQQFDIAKLL